MPLAGSCGLVGAGEIGTLAGTGIVGTENDLAEALPPLPDLSTPFHLLMHEDMRQVPRVRAFFDFVVREIGLVRSVLEG